MGRQREDWGSVALQDSMVSLIKELLVLVIYFNLLGWVTFLGRRKEGRDVLKQEPKLIFSWAFVLSSMNGVKSDGL